MIRAFSTISFQKILLLGVNKLLTSMCGNFKFISKIITENNKPIPAANFLGAASISFGFIFKILCKIFFAIIFNKESS
jgi:hypothetical protein